jgi:hypothetical protein
VQAAMSRTFENVSALVNYESPAGLWPEYAKSSLRSFVDSNISLIASDKLDKVGNLKIMESFYLPCHVWQGPVVARIVSLLFLLFLLEFGLEFNIGDISWMPKWCYRFFLFDTFG